jgi:hypothetical protein
LRQWTKLNNHTLPLNAVLDITCSKSELVLENALLRQQLIIFQRQTEHPRFTWRDRAVLAEKPIRSVTGRENSETRCSWRR